MEKMNAVFDNAYGSISVGEVREKRGAGYKPVSSSVSSVEDMEDNFVPAFESSERLSSSSTAVFSLLNTVLGGGVLSLPYAFLKLGWAVALFVISVASYMSCLSLSMLCVMASKTGSRSYSDIIRKTLGANAPELVDLVLFLLLFLVMIAFMILMNDITGDCAEYLFLTEENTYSKDTRHKFSTAISMLFIYPLITQESLHSLRHASYCGFISILLLMGVLIHKCSNLNFNEDRDMWAREANAVPLSFEDFLTGIPMILIAFLVQFNMIDVYAKLKKPSEAHANSVIYVTIGISATMLFIFGLAGYFYAYAATDDNILENFSPRDPALIYARIGLVVTLICQIPMIGLPMRNNFILCVSHLRRLTQGRRMRSQSIISIENLAEFYRMNINLEREAAESGLYDLEDLEGEMGHNQDQGGGSSSGTASTATGSTDQEQVGLELTTHSSYSMGSYSSQSHAATILSGDEDAGGSDEDLDQNQNQNQRRERVVGSSGGSSGPIPGPGFGGVRANSYIRKEIQSREISTTDGYINRYIIPLCLTVVCIVISQELPGVKVIWSVCGSSVSILLGFLLPSLAYIRLWQKNNNTTNTTNMTNMTTQDTGSADKGKGKDKYADIEGDIYISVERVEVPWTETPIDVKKAYVMYYFSLVLMVLCTYQSVVMNFE